MDYMETFRMILSDAIKSSIESERKALILKRVAIVQAVVIVFLIAGYFI